MAPADAPRFAAADLGRRPSIMVITATADPRAPARRLPQLAGDAWNDAEALRVGKWLPQLAGDAWNTTAAPWMGNWLPQFTSHPRNVFVRAAVTRRIVSRHRRSRNAADAEHTAGVLPGSRSGHPAARTDRDAWNAAAALRVGTRLPQLAGDAWNTAATPRVGNWLPQLTSHARNVTTRAASSVVRIVSRHRQSRDAADAEHIAGLLPGSRRGHPAARTDPRSRCAVPCGTE